MSFLSLLFGRKQKRQPAPPREPHTSRFDVHRGIDARANSDIISGHRFCATMQLRTPLRVLSRHGEVHKGLDRLPPQIAREMWEGIWIVELRPWRELGINAKEIPLGTMASDIGQVPADGGEYLQFLIAVRTAAEAEGSVETRRGAVAQVMANPAWAEFVRAHQGREAVLDKLFPPFLTTIPRLPAKAAAALMSGGFGTPSALAGANDSELLAVSGVGPAIVSAIRRECQKVKHPNSAFVDRVIR
ncbi:MAG: helix-hairpin-helix domain-containing protein [Allosphingosinicella sp.]